MAVKIEFEETYPTLNNSLGPNSDCSVFLGHPVGPFLMPLGAFKQKGHVI